MCSYICVWNLYIITICYFVFYNNCIYPSIIFIITYIAFNCTNRTSRQSLLHRAPPPSPTTFKMRVDIPCKAVRSAPAEVYIEIAASMETSSKRATPAFWMSLCDAFNARSARGIMKIMTAVCRDGDGIEFVSNEPETWLGSHIAAECAHLPKRINGEAVFFMEGNSVVFRFSATQDCPLAAMMVLYNILSGDTTKHICNCDGLPPPNDLAWDVVYGTLVPVAAPAAEVSRPETISDQGDSL